MQIRIEEKGKGDIALIKPLWEKLNKLHCQKSVHFKEKYRSWTFESRMAHLSEKFEKGLLKLDMLYDEEADKHVGYCLSSIADGKGEVESLYVESSYRGKGLGGLLMQNASEWFSENGVTDIMLMVAYDNKETLPFYQHCGFFVSAYQLKKKPQK